MKRSNIGFCEFTDEFRAHGREDQFSYEGLRALYDYLEELEESIGEEIELDVVALCCEYSEVDCDDSGYANYIGDDAERGEFLVAELRHSLLVREG